MCKALLGFCNTLCNVLLDLFSKVVREFHQSFTDYYMQALCWGYQDESEVFPDLWSSEYSVRKKKLQWSMRVEVLCKELYECRERNDSLRRASEGLTKEMIFQLIS